jgi:hypothetical protein
VRDEFGDDDHGYQRGKCPRCGRVVWSDTCRFECVCGYDSDGAALDESEDSIEDEDGDELPFNEREVDERV